MSADTLNETVKALERRRARAMIESDISILSEIFADDLVYNHSSGGRDTKVSLLKKITTGIIQYLEIENVDQEVTVFGETAVVSGRMMARVKVGGELKLLNNSTMAVWVLSDGYYQFLAFQSSAVAGV